MLQIKVSDIVTYLICPRRVYFHYRERESLNLNIKYIENLLLKELSIRYHEVLKRDSLKDDDLYPLLKSRYLHLCEEFDLIYPEVLKKTDEETICSSKNNIESCIENICANLNAQLTQYGPELMLEYLTPVSIEPYLYSDKTGIAGSPTMIVMDSDKQVPMVIKGGKYPDNGIWKNDRIHLASLAMLTEEKYSNTAGTGFVLYSREAVIRKAGIRSTDRRQVLKIRNRIKNIKNGMMPEGKNSDLCTNCIYSNLCKSRKSLMSKFF